MEIINAIENTCITSRPKVRNISLSEEICYVGCWINDRCSYDANGIGDIVAPNLSLQKRRMYLPSIDWSSGFGVQSPDPILGGCNEKDLWTPIGGVYKRFCVELRVKMRSAMPRAHSLIIDSHFFQGIVLI